MSQVDCKSVGLAVVGACAACSNVVSEGAGRRVGARLAVESRKRAAVASAVKRHHARGRRRGGRWEVSVRWRSGRLGALPSLSVPVGVGGSGHACCPRGCFLSGRSLELALALGGWGGRRMARLGVGGRSPPCLGGERTMGLWVGSYWRRSVCGLSCSGGVWPWGVVTGGRGCGSGERAGFQP